MTGDQLREEFIVCFAAGYPDPYRPHPNTLANAERFRDEGRRLPEFPAIVKRRVVSDWREVVPDPLRDRTGG